MWLIITEKTLLANDSRNTKISIRDNLLLNVANKNNTQAAEMKEHNTIKKMIILHQAV